VPEAAVTASGVALTLGGASVVFGIKPGLGAAAVAGFLVGGISYHARFLGGQDPEKRQSEMINFTKNMALLGGLLALKGVGDAKARNCL
jgi:putative oxidoreductase